MRVFVADSAPYVAVRQRAADTFGEYIVRELDLHVQLAAHATHVNDLADAPGRWTWTGDATIESRVDGDVTLTWEVLNEDHDRTSDRDEVTSLVLVSITRGDKT